MLLVCVRTSVALPFVCEQAYSRCCHRVLPSSFFPRPSQLYRSPKVWYTKVGAFSVQQMRAEDKLVAGEDEFDAGLQTAKWLLSYLAKG